MQKKISFILIFIFTVLFVQIAAVHAQKNPSDKLRTIAIPTDSIPPDSTDMRDLTSLELSKEMVPGWNLGNSLEAIGGETSWGNPKTTQRLIDSVKAAGFNAVRIPVAWSNNMNMTTFEIDEDLLYRVEEVVNFALDNDMYAIINIHWDGGWMQPTYDQQEYVNNRLATIWRQIAIFFRDYTDYLLFAGTNEVMVDGDYGTPKKEYYTVQNSYNQTFVTTVRSTGGCNHFRHLVVQGFNTNIDYTASYFTIPKDVIENRLMVEVHYYDPYNFTINSNSSIIQWGKDATDPSKTETWANESWADGQFNKMKTKFIDKGYGVILGEYGAMARTKLGSDALNAEHAKYRLYYMEYITGSIYKHGLVPFYWDSGFTGNNASGLFDRTSGEQAYPEIITAIMDATQPATRVEPEKSKLQPKKQWLLQNYPNPFNPVTHISFDIPSQGYVSLKIFDIMGREVTTLVAAELPAGQYTRSWNASGVSSGEYFCRLQTGDILETRKLILLR